MEFSLTHTTNTINTLFEHFCTFGTYDQNCTLLASFKITLFHKRCVGKKRGLGRKEEIVLFNDTLNILFTVIWCWTYGKGPFR